MEYELPEEGEFTNMSSDYNQYYEEALNAESVVIRTFREWEQVQLPWTEDDLIDTMLFIHNLKES